MNCEGIKYGQLSVFFYLESAFWGRDVSWFVFKHEVLGSVLVYFPVALFKYFDQSNLRKRGLLGLTVQATAYPGKEVTAVEA